MAQASALMFISASFVLTILTVANAFMQKKQFYPSVVYITKSSPSMAVMYIQGLVAAYVLFQIVRKLFFGQLRAAETEHLMERMWHAVMETCLAFTVFREAFSPSFVMLFVLLLFIKSFHWLCEDRVDFMERSPVITMLFHVRMISLLGFLSMMDSFFVSHAYFTTLQKGASVQIVFGFEYAILMTAVLHVAIKYILHMHDLRRVHPWENKAVYLLYSELVINLLRCLLYVVFVLVMIRLHTFPLFSIRPLYLSLRASHKAVTDVIRSRRAIHAMNSLFPLATEQELAQGDNTCIICREEMTVMSGPKKLPCNHIFHPNCLRSWFQRQQSCPTCRTDILAERRPAAAAPVPPPRVEPPAGQAAFGQIPPPLVGEVPPNMFPFIAHHFGFPPPPQHQNGRGESRGNGQNDGSQASADPATSTTASSTSGNANSSANVRGTSGMPGQIPWIPPAFPFMPPQNSFMMMPPPLPFPFPAPPSFSGLSDAEIAAMEGRERAAIEARINCLRDVGILLDAAVVQLQQYCSIVQALSVNPTASNSEDSGHCNEFGSAPQSTSQATSSTLAGATLINKEGPDEEHLNKPLCASGLSPNADVNEIRQRRLQKFLERTEQSSEGDTNNKNRVVSD